MRLPAWLRVTTLLVSCATGAFAQEEPCGPPTQPAYEDSVDGLEKFLDDIVAALKAKRKKEAETLAASLLIPHPERCFASIFGEEEGKRLEKIYSKVRSFRREPIPLGLRNAAEQENARFQAERIQEATPGRRSLYVAVLGAMRVSTPLYSAWYTKDGGEDSYSLDAFLYTSGGFRLVENMVFHALSTAPPMRIIVGGNVQQARLLHKPNPRYPEEAKAARIQGTVRLQVVIGTDGTIQELRVVSGPAELVDSAITAVRQWRYQTTLLNGLPVEVSSTIDVLYTLSR